MAKDFMTEYKIASAKWSVMWVSGGRIVEKKFEHELSEAMDFAVRVKVSGRKGVTLRCCNVGHPPPDKYTHAQVEKVVRRRIKRGPHTGKTVKVKQIEVVDRMPQLNRQGIYWCPYCMKMRRFLEIKGRREVLVQCPMCKITSRDFHVRRWNPQALYLSYHKGKQRRAGGKGRRRRRNSK